MRESTRKAQLIIDGDVLDVVVRRIDIYHCRLEDANFDMTDYEILCEYVRIIDKYTE